jgi:hypothetical protein
MKKPNLDIRDIFFIGGLCLFAAGIGMFSVAAAMIAVGAIFLAMALFGARGKK